MPTPKEIEKQRTEALKRIEEKLDFLIDLFTEDEEDLSEVK